MIPVRSVIQTFLGEQRRGGQSTVNHHDRPYSEIVKGSPFRTVEEVHVPVQWVWTTESILGYLYSTSFAVPRLFGDRLGDFEREVTAALTELSDDDTFSEDNEFLIRIGRRSWA